MSLAAVVFAAPVQTDTSTSCRSDPDCGPVPGESSIYSDYTGKSAPFPADSTAPVPATTAGPAREDDILFQNLLSAEWAAFSFYQQGVEAFNESSFIDLGFTNTTYQRIAEIRDNEAGHLRIFPGFDLNIIEVSSMAFLTGLAQQAKTNATTSALVAIAETESRHETWALIDIWGEDPFAGPADTTFAYANQILYITTASFIIPGSCPSENPAYPNPSQNLPQFDYNSTTSTGHPGSPITFVYRENKYTSKISVPDYVSGKDYYAVFFHGVNNITEPYDTKTNSSVIPAVFDSKGIILVVIADTPGAPTLDSVVAGPMILLQQPASATNITGIA
ncbi:hypothetical protein ABVK25_012539 [Lepraria finkii]|uniref:Rds1 n=1 Tax=Lepraria finkii TaxID=1340010 RepID=A0ABR4AF50_9LECA